MPSSAITGFPPLGSTRATILILGSMPGAASLQAQEYYAYKHNAFWRIMQALYGISADAPYRKRCRLLMQQGVAVWDTVHRCIRETSSDSDILTGSVVANDFDTFYRRHRRINHIYFNGTAAARLYQRHVLPLLPPNTAALARTTLPSTSPANAALSFADKLTRWQVIRYKKAKR